MVKQLIDSPAQPCSFLIDPAIQSIKYNDFTYKAQSLEKEAKDSRKKSLPEGNIKSLLFGEAARKLQKDFKTIPPHPFVSLDSPTLLTNYMGKPNNPTFEFRVKIWDNFSFDIQAILKALK